MLRGSFVRNSIFFLANGRGAYVGVVALESYLYGVGVDCVYGSGFRVYKFGENRVKDGLKSLKL